MPLPFMPLGALLAAAVLGGAFVAFGLALRALDRAALATRSSIVPGLVAGLRTWSHAMGERSVLESPAGRGRPPSPVPMIDELVGAGDVALDRVHRR